MHYAIAFLKQLTDIRDSCRLYSCRSRHRQRRRKLFASTGEENNALIILANRDHVP